MNRPWSQHELAILRAAYASYGPRTVGRWLCRTESAVKSRAQKLRLMTSRRWTSEQDAQLRRMLHTVPASEIAARFGCHVTRVYKRVRQLGLSRPPKRLPPNWEATLRARNASGWSDAEIAAELGFSRELIRDKRRELGLTNNLLSEHRRDRVRQKTREQLAKAGLPSLAAVRAKVFRDRARAAGWPEDLRPRAVEILNALWTRGPMTRKEIAKAIGMPWHTVRSSLNSNDPEGSYLANLIKRGLVISLGRKVKGRGRGHSRCLYSLSLWIQRRPFEVKHDRRVG